MSKSKVKLEKELSKKLQQLNERETLEGLIKNNKIEFEVKGKKYRVHKPNQAESLEARKARTKKYIELLKSNDYMLREQLIELYKEKGVNIEKLEADIKEVGYQIEDVQVKLAQVPTANIKTIDDYKNQINDLITKQSKISIRLTELLEPCLENEILEFSNFYLVYLALEKQDKDKWEKYFTTYGDFLNSNEEELILESTYNLSMLIFKAKI